MFDTIFLHLQIGETKGLFEEHFKQTSHWKKNTDDRKWSTGAASADYQATRLLEIIVLIDGNRDKEIETKF